MNLVSLLTETEKQAMKSYIETYAFHGGNGGEMSTTVDHLLRPWSEAKSEYLYDMFGQQFILKKEVQYDKDNTELERELQNRFYDTSLPGSKFIEDFLNYVHDNYYRGCDTGMEYYHMRDIASAWLLAGNKWNGDTFSVEVAGKEPVKIQNGCRCTKALGKLAAAFGLEGFEEFRLMHSQVLNQKSLKGTLCLSIHPLDYMTMSDNECDWESCMSWKNDGCYRQGTVEMMNSPMVVVAYLTAKEDMQLGWRSDFRWNNKKWRELFIIHNDVITNVKSYPYWNPQLTAAALDWLKELATQAKVGTYLDTCSKWYYENQSSCDELVDANATMWFETSFMYNDFEAESEQMSYFSSTLSSGSHYINYSGPSQCMCCGATGDGYYEIEGCLVCEDCEGWKTCDQCDSRIYDSSDVHIVDDMVFCDHCYEYQTFEDDYDGEIHANCNGVRRIHLGINPEHFKYLKDGNTALASNEWAAYRHCAAVTSIDNFERAQKEWSKKGSVVNVYRRWSADIWYIDYNDATEEFLHVLGFENLDEADNALSPLKGNRPSLNVWTK